MNGNTSDERSEQLKLLVEEFEAAAWTQEECQRNLKVARERAHEVAQKLKRAVGQRDTMLVIRGDGRGVIIHNNYCNGDSEHGLILRPYDERGEALPVVPQFR